MDGPKTAKAMKLPILQALAMTKTMVFLQQRADKVKWTTMVHCNGMTKVPKNVGLK